MLVYVNIGERMEPATNEEPSSNTNLEEETQKSREHRAGTSDNSEVRLTPHFSNTELQKRTLYLEGYVWEALQELANSLGTTLSEALRHRIQDWLQNEDILVEEYQRQEPVYEVRSND